MWYNDQEENKQMLEELYALAEHFIEMKKGLSQMLVPTAKRLYAITSIYEMQFMIKRLKQIHDYFEEVYPFDLDKDKLRHLIEEIDKPIKTQNDSLPFLYSKYKACKDNMLWIPKDKEQEEYVKPDDEDEEILQSVFVSKDDSCFSNYTLFYHVDRRQEWAEFRNFLAEEDGYGFHFFVEHKSIDFKIGLKYLLEVANKPNFTSYRTLCRQVETLFKQTFPDHNDNLYIWRRDKSKKKNYAEKLRIEKDKLRAQIAEHHWDTEWQDMFTYNNIFLLRDNEINQGAFIHLNLQTFKKDDCKLLFEFVRLIREWGFYTNEELVLISEGNDSLRDDLDFVVPVKKEEKNITSINVAGDYVAGNKNVGSHIDNVESGGVGAKIASPGDEEA